MVDTNSSTSASSTNASNATQSTADTSSDATTDTSDIKGTIIEPVTQMYIAPTSTGIQFLCSLVNVIPSDAVELDDATYQALMEADSKGATLSVQNGKAVAVDWQNNVIDLTKVGDTSSYSKPATLAQLAQTAFQNARGKFQDLQMMGQTFGPETQKYMQALNAIITGEDTKSTELPTPPTDFTK